MTSKVWGIKRSRIESPGVSKNRGKTPQNHPNFNRVWNHEINRNKPSILGVVVTPYFWNHPSRLFIDISPGTNLIFRWLDDDLGYAEMPLVGFNDGIEIFNPIGNITRKNHSTHNVWMEMFQVFLEFSPRSLGKRCNFEEHIFRNGMGKNHQLTICFQMDTPTKPPPSFSIASTNQVIMLYGVPLSTCVTDLSGNDVVG